MYKPCTGRCPAAQHHQGPHTCSCKIQVAGKKAAKRLSSDCSKRTGLVQEARYPADQHHQGPRTCSCSNIEQDSQAAQRLVVKGKCTAQEFAGRCPAARNYQGPLTCSWNIKVAGKRAAREIVRGRATVLCTGLVQEATSPADRHHQAHVHAAAKLKKLLTWESHTIEVILHWATGAYTGTGPYTGRFPAAPHTCSCSRISKKP
jgi:hypothetical protein